MSSDYKYPLLHPARSFTYPLAYLGNTRVIDPKMPGKYGLEVPFTSLGNSGLRVSKVILGAGSYGLSQRSHGIRTQQIDSRLALGVRGN